MAVINPLIKSFKGAALKLYTEYQEYKSINDHSENLINFYETLEDIFYKGFIIENRKNIIFQFNKKDDIFNCYSSINIDNYTYNNCIEYAKKSKKVRTTLGKFRQLIKSCLVKKCLHIPVEYLIEHKKNVTFYEKDSILGDEILAQIFLSVLQQCSRIKFNLEIENSSFLDYSWETPIREKLELVPSKRLGIGVSFNEDRAIIVSIHPNSVIAENGKVQIGDMLEILNDVLITSKIQGSLLQIFQLNKGSPSTLTTCKALGKNGEIFPPIRHILLNLQLDLDHILNRNLNTVKDTTTMLKPGFDSLYLGCVQVGDKGDVKHLHKALKFFLNVDSKNNGNNCNNFKIEVKCDRNVFIEIGEMKVKIIDVKTNSCILKHPFTIISSCGALTNYPNHIAYIAEDEYSDYSRFFCYIFFIEDGEKARGILHSIGQGFQRTHFMV